MFKNDGTWCSTKVDSTGTHIQGHWGKCNNHCKVENMPDKTSGRMLAGRLLINPFQDKISRQFFKQKTKQKILRFFYDY